MLKVLVVEDDSDVADVVGKVLSAEGFLPVVATDLEGAWHALIREDPDAAIVDIWLHGADVGWSIIRRIRENEHFSTLPVTVLTGAAREDAAAMAASLGCEFVAKPFATATLLDRLRRAIKASGRAPGLHTASVRLIAKTHTVEGTVHLPTELERFSDAWHAAIAGPRDYLPVTDATVIDSAGATVATAPLILVRKADVLIALPRD